MSFVAALLFEAAGLGETAIDHAVVGNIELGVFPRAHANIAALAPAALAEECGADRGVRPIRWRPIIRIAEEKSLGRGIARVRNHEARLAAAGGRQSGVGQVNDGNVE